MGRQHIRNGLISLTQLKTRLIFQSRYYPRLPRQLPRRHRPTRRSRWCQPVSRLPTTRLRIGSANGCT